MKYCVDASDRYHTIYRFTDTIFKIVQFYDWHPRTGPGPREQQKHHKKKLDSSLSRAKRVILEKALCNHWEWFASFTISPDKHDRQDLSGWWKKFSQWLRDQRKKGYDVRFLIVPERHEKYNAWHCHALLAGIPESDLVSFRELAAAGVPLPANLRNSSYFNWVSYAERFGWCSVGPIKNRVACGFYVTKYITKDLERSVSKVGAHTYYCSRGLSGAEKHLDYFGRDPVLERYLVNKYDFCATGMTSARDRLDWTFGLDLLGQLDPLDLSADEGAAYLDPALIEANDYFEFEQLVFDSGMV